MFKILMDVSSLSAGDMGSSCVFWQFSVLCCGPSFSFHFTVGCSFIFKMSILLYWYVIITTLFVFSSWTSATPLLGHRSWSRLKMRRKFASFTKSAWELKLRLTALVMNGKDMSCELLVVTTNKVSPWSRVSSPQVLFHSTRSTTNGLMILFSGRVRLLFSKGHSCYRERRTGERKRKSVRGCIVDANLSVLAVVIVKKGEQVIFVF